jgi:hypothetical protein
MRAVELNSVIRSAAKVLLMKLEPTSEVGVDTASQMLLSYRTPRTLQSQSAYEAR